MTKVLNALWCRRPPEEMQLKGLEVDWNQTLLTIINQMGTLLYKKNSDAINSKGTPKKMATPQIFIHENVEELFESLITYDEKHKKLGGRFDVTIDRKSEPDIILLKQGKYVAKIKILDESHSPLRMQQ